jgi:hypothetical protein
MQRADENSPQQAAGYQRPKAENLKTIPTGFPGYEAVYSPSQSLDSSHTGG